MGIYNVDIYDEQTYASQYPQLYAVSSSLVNKAEFVFMQCMQLDPGGVIEVAYEHLDNEDRSATLEFDAAGNLLSFSDEED